MDLDSIDSVRGLDETDNDDDDDDYLQISRFRNKIKFGVYQSMLPIDQEKKNNVYHDQSNIFGYSQETRQ